MSQTKEQSKVIECLKRIQNHPGVVGVIVCNNEAIPSYSSLDNSTTLQYSQSLNTLLQKCSGAVRTLDPQNELNFIRIRTRKHELMVAPVADLRLVCVQTPSDN